MHWIHRAERFGPRHEWGIRKEHGEPNNTRTCLKPNCAYTSPSVSNDENCRKKGKIFRCAANVPIDGDARSVLAGSYEREYMCVAVSGSWYRGRKDGYLL
ncbi:hypothetical protein P691DRAFT_810858 [Macrolepiota fuliginosa MF-IS2]|uniref:Uncharacterized protein n=1 Tax=Macrolepiota fuliginosa MF-IS2 TaxID=1400762 RepID=A0A9P5XNR0_9AGAR|nr:hypothetical protein P691DRAFT_810858 [Macrolepiota fuliginosa MF-IS2]